jgi:hypothetical protein
VRLLIFFRLLFLLNLSVPNETPAAELRLTRKPGVRLSVSGNVTRRTVGVQVQRAAHAMIARTDGAHLWHETRALSNSRSVGARDTLLVDWAPDDRYLSLNEGLTQALRTMHLTFPFFDDRKPSQAAAVSSDAR